MIDALNTGLQLTVLGMGLVFLLLAALWGLMTLLLRMDQSPQSAPAAEREEAVAPAGLEADRLAAITIAVMMHRRVRRRQAAPALRAHRPGTLPSRWVSAGRVRQNRPVIPNDEEKPCDATNSILLTKNTRLTFKN